MYINVTTTILNIIHRPALHLKQRFEDVLTGPETETVSIDWAKQYVPS
jgi:hypothetical protein